MPSLKALKTRLKPSKYKENNQLLSYEEKVERRPRQYV